MFRASVLTLFPEVFPGPLAASLVGRALRKGIWSLTCHNLHEFSPDGRVDDTPAGGGAGMVMRVDVLDRALKHVVSCAPRGVPLIYPTPRGQPLTQAFVREISQNEGVILLCGRFEGIDERIFLLHPLVEMSLGDFILSGGEVAVMAFLESVVRLLPRVVGNARSTQEESFENGLLEYPQYTRPNQFEGLEIPPVLLSGHHERIRSWRQQQAEIATSKQRPDLWQKYLEKRNRTC